ncbi:MAG: hypothetical protein KDA84_10030 [Planctomycetaceae bacterium]|nr:hypothetical protein [Planctomycetaceae bacterium]
MSSYLCELMPDTEGTRDIAQEINSAICYRMEPSKRIGKIPSCQSGCSQNSPPCGSPPCLLSDQSHTVIDVEQTHRLAMMITPQAVGDVTDQIWEALSTIRVILKQQPEPMQVTSQTVFLRRAEDAQTCRNLFRAYFQDRMPATNFVVQPPCGGQALAIEAWAVGGENVEVEFLDPGVVRISYDGLRWIYVVGVNPPASITAAYPQSKCAFKMMNRRLENAGGTFRDVVRTWLYQGGITQDERDIERYRELNRARTDFFSDLSEQDRMPRRDDGTAFYPASTGIGTNGLGLTTSCMALQTDRDDVRLVSLENPHQTSAFNYAKSFSVKSPKFARAMSVLIGDYATTWISGTASIINSESVHLGDAARQTEQTIDNIQNLISRKNFERHGVFGAGAELEDLAKVRVYIKRPEDYETCRAICERRFHSVPSIYAQADVCRSNLLVEIEGVAFSKVS